MFDEKEHWIIIILCSPGAKVVSLSGKSSDQVVHSQGRVMADRSVLFKYVNPNLGFLMAEGKDASLKNFINVYLVRSQQTFFRLSIPPLNSPRVFRSIWWLGGSSSPSLTNAWPDPTTWSTRKTGLCTLTTTKSLAEQSWQGEETHVVQTKLQWQLTYFSVHSLELYEGKTQSNSTVFSSLHNNVRWKLG